MAFDDGPAMPIDGNLVHGGATFVVVNPATEEVIAKVPISGGHAGTRRRRAERTAEGGRRVTVPNTCPAPAVR